MERIIQFRPRRPGPEAVIQDIIARRIPHLFSMDHGCIWTAASLPVGAGIPDLVVASYSPQIFALAQLRDSNPYLLAYLRAVGPVRVETIAQRTGISVRAASQQVADLLEAQVILRLSARTFVLSPAWREILPEIVTIEVKISDWRRAVRQAARNRIFSHRSFVAVPARVAARIRTEAIFKQLGLGLISVSENSTVRLLRRPRRRRPTVWAYYYGVASAVARNSN